MADIDLERKEPGGLGWLWGALALLVLVVVVWWIWPEGEDAMATDSRDDVEAVQPEEPRDAQMTGQAGQVMITDILDDPETYIGQAFPGMVVEVAEVPTDRGFWIEAEGERLFAIIVDGPREAPIDINPGATLTIVGGTLRDASYLPDLPGEPLDEQTEETAREQEIFLVVDEANVTIADEARM